MMEPKQAIKSIHKLILDTPDINKKPTDLDIAYDLLLELDKAVTKIYNICREVY